MPAPTDNGSPLDAAVDVADLTLDGAGCGHPPTGELCLEASIVGRLACRCDPL